MEGIKSYLAQTTRRLRTALSAAEVDSDELERALNAAASEQPPPVLWLLGTTQSGKTSIVRTLTGSSEAEVGNGFQPCTRTAYLYDFPGDAPVISFLDTRGLGEAGYDAEEDLALCESRASLLIVVVRVTEPRPAEVLEAVRLVRKRHPAWPVIIAQTCLHEAYPADSDHVAPYPFDDPGWSSRVPDGLRRLVLSQREAFESSPGLAEVIWVPIDFTLPEDGFTPHDYGLDALWSAIEHAAFVGLRNRVVADPEVGDVYSRAAHPQIVGYSLAAASVGALPLVDLALVPTLQARMLHSLAETYRLKWTTRNTSEFLGLFGVGFAAVYGLRLAGRSVVKLIPVWGQAVGAVWGGSASFLTTFALGKAACRYLAYRREGVAVDSRQVRAAFRDAVKRGRDILPRRDDGDEK